MSLSVGILTFNSEKHIREVLNSVKEVADQIVVLDSGSTDRTPDIVKESVSYTHLTLPTKA